MPNLENLKKSRYKPCNRALALSTALFLIIESLLPAGWAQQTIPSSPLHASASVIENFSFPLEWGHISEIASSPENSGAPVIFIQDAHSDPQGQRHMALILEKLAEEKRIEAVGLEGAFGPVKPRNLGFLDDQEANKKMLERWMDQGELSGAELFGFEQALPIAGVDDPRLYEESFELFETVKHDTHLQEFLDELLHLQEQAELRHLSKTQQRYLQLKRQWEKKGSGARIYFEQIRTLAQQYLSLDLADPENQFAYPQLTRLVQAGRKEERLSAGQARHESEKIRSVLETRVKTPAGRFLLQGLEVFEQNRSAENLAQWLHQQHQKIREVRPFFEALYLEMRSAGLHLLDYPAFGECAGLAILQSEIDPAALLEELRPLEKRLETSLAESERQHRVFELEEKRSLLDNLGTLSLSYENYSRLVGEKSPLEQLKELVKSYRRLLPETDFSEKIPAAVFEKAVLFYKLALERDRVLVENLFERWATRKKALVLIAGGFHRQGISQALKMRGLDYMVITPRAGGESRQLYERIMLGHSAPRMPSGGETLMPRILSEDGPALPEGQLARRRQMLVEQALRDQAHLWTGTDEALRKRQSRVLSRAEQAGFSLPPALRSELALALPQVSEVKPDFKVQSSQSFRAASLQGVASAAAEAVRLMRYAQRVDEVRAVYDFTQSARSEMREMDADARRFLDQLPETNWKDRLTAAIGKIDYLKQTMIEKENADLQERQAVLLKKYIRSLPETDTARVITVIEQLMREVYEEYRVEDYPLTHRAIFVLAALDARNFPDVHRQLVDVIERFPLKVYSEAQRIDASDYTNLMRVVEVEHQQTIDKNILVRNAINRFMIGMPRLERRALERESLIRELRKELRKSGEGRLPQMVFLTDIHGGSRVGDLIGHSLGLKNYRGIQNVQDLEQRLEREKISISKQHVIFVGGSDYPDRGPYPYRAFTFIRWLRKYGKLKFINGNHDLWKDWNLFGMHLRVHDTLREIAVSGRLEEGDIEEHAAKISRFVTSVGYDAARLETLEEEKRGVISRFLNAARVGFPQGFQNDIERFANEIIDMGSNENHSIEWWAREWYQHANWGDTMLDEINRTIVNHVLERINSANNLTPEKIDRLRTFLEKTEALPPELASQAPAMLEALQQGRLFLPVDERTFADDPEVQKQQRLIAAMKESNQIIRAKNLIWSAQGRFAELISQHRVPTTFPVTSRLAADYIDKARAALSALHQAFPEVDGAIPDNLDLITPENYRSNPYVAETALWNMQNFRLVYVDVYGNAYLHGIIPIEAGTTNFNVRYKKRTGVEAIEYMQYDIRRFFEKYDSIPDTPEFRALMERKVGKAFRILNDWYSDTLAHLKPLMVQAFVDSGGPAAYSYTTASAMSPRFFNPKAGVLHVGHVDLDKMKKQGLPYWINGMDGGLINGDHDLSEGYTGLGGVITHFSRSTGELTGIRRFGYRATATSMQKEIKKLKAQLQEKKQALQGQNADSAELEEPIAKLTARLAEAEEAYRLHTQQVREKGGESIEDITLHELPQEQEKRVKGFTGGQELARYYLKRFLRENLEAYRKLIQDSRLRGREDRIDHYKKKIEELRRALEVEETDYIKVNVSKYLGRSWDLLSENEIQTVEYYFDFFKGLDALLNWLDAPRKERLLGLIRGSLESPQRLALAILDPEIFTPESQNLNLRLLESLASLAKGFSTLDSSASLEETRQALYEKLKQITRRIERHEQKEIDKLPLVNANDREIKQGRQEALYYHEIRIFSAMGRAGYERLVEFLQPGFSETVRRDARFALQNKEARNFIMGKAMRETNLVQRRALAFILDQLGSPDEDALLFIMHQDRDLYSRLRRIIGEQPVLYSHLLDSPLFSAVSDDHALVFADNTIERLEIFARQFRRADFLELLKNWGLGAVVRWSLDPDIARKLPFFEPLFSVTSSNKGQKPFVEAVRYAENRDDAEYTREVLGLLLHTGDVSVLRGMVSLITTDPTRSHLISFLIVQMKLMQVFFKEDEFIQEEISRLLYSDVGANYYLMRKLAASIPHARRATGQETQIRNLAHEMDRSYKHAHPLFRYQRLKLHASPDTEDLKLVKTIFELTAGMARNMSDRRRLDEAAVRHALEAFQPNARDDIFEALSREDTQRVGQILLAVTPDPDNLTEGFIRLNPDWTKSPHKDSLEFSTAQKLVELLRTVNERYGTGMHQLDPQTAAGLRDNPARLMDVIETLTEQRETNKQEILREAVFDPDDEFQVTKNIHIKRHIAQREWGFSTVGFYATYREARFELFEKDRAMEHLLESLFERFIDERLPELYRMMAILLKRTPGVNANMPLPAALQERALEILKGFELLVSMLELDDVASEKIMVLTREISRPGLTLQQVANIMSSMRDEIQLFLQRLIFIYGDYPKKIALALGPEYVRSSYRKPGDERLERERWAARVQESVMAELFAEERGIQLAQKYIRSVSGFLEQASALKDVYLMERPEKEDAPELITRENFDPYTVSAVDLGYKAYQLFVLLMRGYPVPELVALPASNVRNGVPDVTDVNFRRQVMDALLYLEKETGQVFPFDFSRGTEAERRRIMDFRRKHNMNKEPLILSIRSGSFISMPGMMETALNVPMNDELADTLIKRGMPAKFVMDVYRRFLYSYGTVHLGIDQKIFSHAIDLVKVNLAAGWNVPLEDVTISKFSTVDYERVITAFKKIIREHDPEFGNLSPFDMVLRLVRDVYLSWESEGARRYRARFDISDRFGTAVILQRMVYGNLNSNSGTVVADSSDVMAGVRVPYGNVKVGGQGVELVSGLTRSAQPLNKSVDSEGRSFEETHPDMHRQIRRMVSAIEAQERIPVNTELTFQDGELYLLQARPQIISSSRVQRFLEPAPGRFYQAITQGEPVTANAAVGRLLNARNLKTEELVERFTALRAAMDEAGERELDIILAYDYFSDDDSSSLLEIERVTKNGERSIGIINSGIAFSNHASIIAAKLGYAYVGKVRDLSFNATGQIVFAGQPVSEGMEGHIYSIDGHGPLQSTLSGQIIQEAVPYTLRVPLRSEVRSAPGPVFEVDSRGIEIELQTQPEGQVFVTRPARSFAFDDEWALQRYFAGLYNLLEETVRNPAYGLQHKKAWEIQVRDEMIGQMLGNDELRGVVASAIPDARIQSGFIDQLDLFRLLSKLREKTEIPAYPAMRDPRFSEPQKIALVVDAKVSDLEAAFIRDLVGEPDIVLEAVVGTTPMQLAATLNHSIYRRFLQPGNLQYNQEEGWVSILGRRIPVVRNEEDLSAERWQQLGVTTFVATHPLRKRKEKIIQALTGENGAKPPVRIVALQTFNPFSGTPESETTTPVSLGMEPGDEAVKMENREVLLRPALVDIPVRFLSALKGPFQPKTLTAMDFALNYRVSPMTALPLDKSGESKAPTLNEIPASPEWTAELRKQLRQAFSKAELPGRAIQNVQISSIPAMLGDRLDLTLHLRGEGLNHFFHDLGVFRPSLKTDGDFEKAEEALKEKLLERLGAVNFYPVFQFNRGRAAVNTDTRFERRVLIDAAGLQVSLSQGQNNKIQLSVSIPLVFNRDWQNSRHLAASLFEIARAHSANVPPKQAPADLRLSEYGRAVQYARDHGTLPPAPLDIPEKLTFLRQEPLQIGVVGYAGQIGARVHAAHDLNLNVRAGTGGTPAQIREAFSDSIAGLLTSNGVPLNVIAGESEPHHEHEIGFIQIGDGAPITILRRYDDPRQIPWRRLGVEAVAETTGAFTDPTDPKSLLGHLEAARGNQTGARVAVLSAPFGKPKDKAAQAAIKKFPTVVFGVNDTQIPEFFERAAAENLPFAVSNASCTTNCVATMTVFAQKLRAAVTELLRKDYQFKHAEVGDVELVPVTSVHALTNTQPGYRDSFTKAAVEARHRAGPQATLTKSGVSEAILQLKVSGAESFAQGATGYAVRVPIASSLAVVPMIFKLKGLEEEEPAVLENFETKETSKAFQADVVRLYSEIGRAMAADPRWSEAVAFGEAADAVSSEVAAGSGQIIIDAQQVHVLKRGDQLMVTANVWYDNVTNYAANYMRIFREIAKTLPQEARSEVRMDWQTARNTLSDTLSELTNRLDPQASPYLPTRDRERLRQRGERLTQLLSSDSLDESGELGGLLRGWMDDLTQTGILTEANMPDVRRENLMEAVRVWAFGLAAELKRRADEKRSEVRLLARLSLNDRTPQALLFVAAALAENTVDPKLAAEFENYFRKRLLGQTPETEETIAEDIRLEALQAALRQKMALSESAPAQPRTVLLASLDGKAPLVDLQAMQLAPGSRVIILDPRQAEAAAWNEYKEVKLPAGVRLERETYTGSRPNLSMLTILLAGKTNKKLSNEIEKAARPLLVFPHVTEEILNNYSVIPAGEGLVVRTPARAKRSKTLRFAFSYLLGRNVLPAQLLKETPPDIFELHLRQGMLSPAFIPAGAERGFASWAMAFAARQLIESAA